MKRLVAFALLAAALAGECAGQTLPYVRTKGTVADGDAVTFSGTDGKYIQSAGALGTGTVDYTARSLATSAQATANSAYTAATTAQATASAAATDAQRILDSNSLWAAVTSRADSNLVWSTFATDAQRVLDSNTLAALFESARTNAEGRVSKSGDTMTGALTATQLTASGNAFVGGRLLVGVTEAHPYDLGEFRREANGFGLLNLYNSATGRVASGLRLGVTLAGETNQATIYYTSAETKNLNRMDEIPKAMCLQGDNDGGDLCFGTVGHGCFIVFTGGQTNPANQRMIVLPSGNVGIGTTNPTERLEVQGVIKAGDNVYAGGNFESWFGVWGESALEFTVYPAAFAAEEKYLQFGTNNDHTGLRLDVNGLRCQTNTLNMTNGTWNGLPLTGYATGTPMYVLGDVDLEDLGNVDAVAAPTENDVLTWNGAAWSNDTPAAAEVTAAELQAVGVEVTNNIAGINALGVEVTNNIAGIQAVGLVATNAGAGVVQVGLAATNAGVTALAVGVTATNAQTWAVAGSNLAARVAADFDGSSNDLRSAYDWAVIASNAAAANAANLTPVSNRVDAIYSNGISILQNVGLTITVYYATSPTNWFFYASTSDPTVTVTADASWDRLDGGTVRLDFLGTAAVTFVSETIRNAGRDSSTNLNWSATRVNSLILDKPYGTNRPVSILQISP